MMVDTIESFKISEKVQNNNGLNRSSCGTHITTSFCDLLELDKICCFYPKIQSNTNMMQCLILQVDIKSF